LGCPSIVDGGVCSVTAVDKSPESKISGHCLVDSGYYRQFKPKSCKSSAAIIPEQHDRNDRLLTVRLRELFREGSDIITIPLKVWVVSCLFTVASITCQIGNGRWKEMGNTTFYSLNEEHCKFPRKSVSVSHLFTAQTSVQHLA